MSILSSFLWAFPLFDTNQSAPEQGRAAEDAMEADTNQYSWMGYRGVLIKSRSGHKSAVKRFNQSRGNLFHYPRLYVRRILSARSSSAAYRLHIPIHVVPAAEVLVVACSSADCQFTSRAAVLIRAIQLWGLKDNSLFLWLSRFDTTPPHGWGGRRRRRWTNDDAIVPLHCTVVGITRTHIIDHWMLVVHTLF